MKYFFGALSLALLLAACGTAETYKFTYEAEFVLEGPLFEGPNTGQETVNEALDAWLKENNLLKGQLSNVQLVMAEVSKDPALEAGLVTDAGLTFAADQLDMVTAATLNPFPTDASSGSMKVSEEAELTPFFEQESFILLLDLGLSEDLYDNYVAKANLEFEVTVIK